MTISSWALLGQSLSIPRLFYWMFLYRPLGWTVSCTFFEQSLDFQTVGLSFLEQSSGDLFEQFPDFFLGGSWTFLERCPTLPLNSLLGISLVIFRINSIADFLPTVFWTFKEQSPELSLNSLLDNQDSFLGFSRIFPWTESILCCPLDFFWDVYCTFSGQSSTSGLLFSWTVFSLLFFNSLLSFAFIVSCTSYRKIFCTSFGQFPVYFLLNSLLDCPWTVS